MSTAGERESLSEHAFELPPPGFDWYALIGQFRNLVEAAQHRIELRSIDSLAFVRANADRLLEPAIRQCVVRTAHPEPVIQHPLDADDVHADMVERFGRKPQSRDVPELGGELLQTGQRWAVEQL